MLRRLGALLPLARYRIEGKSMLPTVSPGERVLVNKAAYWLRSPRPGDLVVVRDPRLPSRWLLKRLEAPSDDGWLVAGDNEDASTDSRAFGPVPRRLIAGKVWFRY